MTQRTNEPHDRLLGDQMTQSTPTPALELRDVSKTYGTVQALRSANLTVYPNEVVALIGDNGAGKSTIIKTLSGVIQPDASR